MYVLNSTIFTDSIVLHSVDGISRTDATSVGIAHTIDDVSFDLNRSLNRHRPKFSNIRGKLSLAHFNLLLHYDCDYLAVNLKKVYYTLYSTLL